MASPEKIICGQGIIDSNDNKTNMQIIDDLEDRKCRTCMLVVEADASFTRLNSELIIGEMDQVTLAEMIRSLTSLEPIEEDAYPHSICGECLEKLINAYIFRIQCIRTDSIMRNMIYKIAASTPKHCEKDSNTFHSINIGDDITFPSTLETSHLKDITHLTEQLNSLDRNIDCFSVSDIQEYSEKYQSRGSNDNQNKTIITQSPICETHNAPLVIFDMKESKENTFDKVCLIEHEESNKVVVKKNIPTSDNTKQRSVCKKICMKDKYEKLRFICDICGQSTRTRGILKKHMKRHSKTKGFKCSQCTKAFFLPDDLKKHELCHGVQCYICDMCGALFTRKDSLNVHKKIHFNIKPHACTHCSKRFLNSYNLQNHKRTHLNEAPYICSTCNKGFKQRTALSRHGKIHEKKIT